MLQFLQEEAEPFVRYVHYFDNDFTVETVQELIGVLSAVPSVDLFITTPGGELPAYRVLMHFINNHPDIKIFLTGYIASAGTFFLVDCDKEVVLAEDLDWILFHQGDREFGGKFRSNKIDMDILYEQTKTTNDKFAEKFKRLGLTSKELKLFMAGEDVILYRKDFGRLKIAQV